MESRSSHGSFNFQSQSGMSLLETMIALVVLLIATVGIMAMAMVATSTTENQGHLAARTAEYAQDKMEQLISLAYGDSTTDTTVFPANNSGGTGLAVGGSSDPNAPVTSPGTGYVDYLDRSGNPLTAAGGVAPANWYYIRVWQISTPSGTSNLKQITVAAKVRSGVGSTGIGALPQSILVTMKTNPF
jgi:type II secretory pathway pseudopilin PulG